MKYTIKESQLREMIAESVKKVLSELDARTYASYADKRAAQGEFRKANAGRDAARKAWNDKFAYDKSDANGYSREHMIDTSKTPYGIGYSQMSRGINGDANYSDSGVVNPESDKRTADRYLTARQMAQGNGKYVKGKGWQ